LRKQFLASLARARFHTAWTHTGHQLPGVAADDYAALATRPSISVRNKIDGLRQERLRAAFRAPALFVSGSIYLSSQTSSMRQLLKTLLTMIVRPLT
jgi:50S ribosomal subunit-associated GTPase HflX